jgi:hypothetical protein
VNARASRPLDSSWPVVNQRFSADRHGASLACALHAFRGPPVNRAGLLPPRLSRCFTRIQPALATDAPGSLRITAVRGAPLFSYVICLPYHCADGSAEYLSWSSNRAVVAPGNPMQVGDDRLCRLAESVVVVAGIGTDHPWVPYVGRSH